MSNCIYSCQACLTKRDYFKYNIDDEIAFIFFYCTTIQLAKDGTQKFLCDNCYNFLIQFRDFKRKCEESQISLNKTDVVKSEPSEIATEPVKSLKYELDVENIELPTGVNNLFDDKSNDDTLETFCNDPLTEKKTMKRFKKTRKLETPRKKQTENNVFSFQCTLCNIHFKHEYSLESHISEHKGITVSISCKACNKTYRSRSSLYRHIAAHHTRLRLSELACNLCGKVYKSRNSLNMHEKRAHTGEKKAHICEVCGNSFAKQSTLKVHSEIHKECKEKSHSCDHCGQNFYWRKNLLTHIRRKHSGKRYFCDCCKYPFTDKYNLVKHILKDRRSFKCDICGKCVSSQDSLVNHTRTHTGERPHACPHCGRTFAARRTLRDHVHTHTGDKPYKCPDCDKHFAQRSTRMRHARRHHNNMSTTHVPTSVTS